MAFQIEDIKKTFESPDFNEYLLNRITTYCSDPLFVEKRDQQNKKIFEPTPLVFRGVKLITKRLDQLKVESQSGKSKKSAEDIAEQMERIKRVMETVKDIKAKIERGEQTTEDVGDLYLTLNRFISNQIKEAFLNNLSYLPQLSPFYNGKPVKKVIDIFNDVLARANDLAKGNDPAKPLGGIEAVDDEKIVQAIHDVVKIKMLENTLTNNTLITQVSKDLLSELSEQEAITNPKLARLIPIYSAFVAERLKPQVPKMLKSSKLKELQQTDPENYAFKYLIQVHKSISNKLKTTNFFNHEILNLEKRMTNVNEKIDSKEMDRVFLKIEMHL